MARRVVPLTKLPADEMDGSRAYAIVDALNVEWGDLIGSSAAEVVCWAARHRVLRTCRDLGDVLVKVEAEPDSALGALLHEAAHGSRIAARAVLQTLLGKLVLMARRSRNAGVDDFVAALWCRIMAYPLERRPHRIAANLALDTLKDVTRLVPRPEVEKPVPWPPGEHLEELFGGSERVVRGDELTAAALIGAAVDLKVIERSTAAVLTTVYVEGFSSTLAAARHRTTADVIRYRCSRGTRQMRIQVAELIGAA